MIWLRLLIGFMIGLVLLALASCVVSLVFWFAAKGMSMLLTAMGFW